jgi:hypothetical protein
MVITKMTLTKPLSYYEKKETTTTTTRPKQAVSIVGGNSKRPQPIQAADPYGGRAGNPKRLKSYHG